LYLQPTEYVHLFDATNDHREMFKPIIKGRQCRELKRDVHEKEGNARKDAAELAEAQEQAISKRATAYGSLFNSRKLTLTKKAGALKLKDRMKMPLDRKRALVKKKAELLDMYEEAEGVLEMDVNELFAVFYHLVDVFVGLRDLVDQRLGLTKRDVAHRLF